MKKSIKLILIVLVGISVILAGYQLYQRHSIESKDKNVELTMEWVQFKDFAKKAGIAPSEAIKIVDGTVSGFVFKEQLFIDLQSDGSVLQKNPMELSMSVAAGDSNIYDLNGKKVSAQDINFDSTYYVVNNQSICDRITTNLSNKRIAKYNVYNIRSGSEIYPLLAIDASANSLSAVGLGFDETTMAMLSDAGFNIIPQIRSWSGYMVGDFDKILSGLGDYNISAVLFNDLNLPGVELSGDEQTGAFKDIGKALTERSIPIATLEFYAQKGINSVINAHDRNMVRAHVVADNEMSTITKDKVLDRYSLAVRERNIRILYVKLFSQMDFDSNMEFVNEVNSIVADSGFTVKTPSSMADVPYNNLFTIIFALGIVAAGIYLLSLLGYEKLGYVIAILAFLCVLGLVFINKDVLATKLLALLASIVFPTLGITLFMDSKPKSIGASLVAFLKITAVTICGGMIIASLLGDKSFMYAIDTFTGVKLSQIIPILLIFFIFVFYKCENMSPVDKMKSVCAEPVKFGYLAIIGVLGIVMLIFMLRTGNDGMSVSSLELALRTKLDQLLVVRPRTKEFMLGVPAMLIAIKLGYKDRYLPILLLGVIGQVSMSNTFCHLHTPVLVSIIRTFNGIWLGLVIGVVCILVGQLLWKICSKYFFNTGEQK